MLILSRRCDQSIIIDNHIKITILRNDGLNVSVGIDAPKDIPVDREEIHLLKQAEKEINFNV